MTTLALGIHTLEDRYAQTMPYEEPTAISQQCIVKEGRSAHLRGARRLTLHLLLIRKTASANAEKTTTAAEFGDRDLALL